MWGGGRVRKEGFFHMGFEKRWRVGEMERFRKAAVDSKSSREEVSCPISGMWSVIDDSGRGME